MTRYASPARSDLFLANCHAPPQESEVELDEDEDEDESELPLDATEPRLVEDLGGDMAADNFAAVSNSIGDYNNMKLKDLKELCKESGLPVKGKKDELIARLQEHSKVRSLLFCPALLYFGAETELLQDTADDEEETPPVSKKDKKKRKSGDDGKKDKKKKKKQKK